MSYSTIDDISTDKYIEEKLWAFEENFKTVGQQLILSYFTRVERKAFLIFLDFSKIVWEEWVVPVKVLVLSTRVLLLSQECNRPTYAPAEI